MDLEKIYSITNTWFKDVHPNEADIYISIFRNCLNTVTEKVDNLSKDDVICFSSYIAFLITGNIKEENEIYSHINELCIEYLQKACNNKQFFYNAFNKYIKSPINNYNQTNILLAIYDKIYYLFKNNFKILLRTFPIIKGEFLKLIAVILSLVIFNLIYKHVNLPFLKYVVYTILIIFTINIFITRDIKIKIDKLNKIKFEQYTLVFAYLHDKLNDI